MRRPGQGAMRNYHFAKPGMGVDEGCRAGANHKMELRRARDCRNNIPPLHGSFANFPTKRFRYGRDRCVVGVSKPVRAEYREPMARFFQSVENEAQAV